MKNLTESNLKVKFDSGNEAEIEHNQTFSLKKELTIDFGGITAEVSRRVE
ncbi:MAG: hypothetical protein ACQEP9_10175 [Bacillota bacterium]